MELIIPAFIAGLLTFLAPCTLPILPAYLGFIGGASATELQNPVLAGSAKRRIFLNGLVFIVGFSSVFIIFGTLAGFLGQALVPYRVWLTRIGGIIVILFGLSLLGLFRLPFFNIAERLNFSSQNSGRPATSFLLGVSFAFGWTPCVGPILGSILLLASSAATALKGAFLLLVFSSGLAIPFLIVAAGIGAASRAISRISKYLRVVEFIGGLFLILLGYLLFTDNFVVLITYGYRLFKFINYGGLIDYL